MTGPAVVPAHNGAAAARGGCCERCAMVWALDEIATAGMHGWPIPTDAIDQLPPWRAALHVGVALAAGAPLEHGTVDDLKAAASSRAGTGPGWWRAYLQLEPGRRRPAPAGARNQRL